MSMNRKPARSSSNRPSVPATLSGAAGKLPHLKISRKNGKVTASFANGMGTGYVAAGSNRRSMRGFFAFANPPEVDIDSKLEKIRASSRDLYMNAPIANGVIKRARTMIINSGLTLQARVDRKFLGLSDDQADEWEDNTEREFRLWARSKNCDAMRRHDFYALQGLALMSQLMSGDVFVLLPYVQRNGWPFRFCLKLVEADYVCNPNQTMDTETLVSGVETDSTGQVIAYQMADKHPNNGMYPVKWTRIDAFGTKSGRQNVLHMFDAERPGQRRGIPYLAPVIESLKQITRLSEAELMAAVVTSFLTVFIETPAANPMQDGVPEDEKITDPENRVADQGTVELGNGSVVGLNPGEKVTPIDPKRPNAAFSPFFDAIVTQIGASLEQPKEVVMLAFESSYSASRAALLQAWKWFLARRNAFKREFCCPSYEEWLGEAVMLGRITAQGFFSDPAIRAAWSGSDWIGCGMGQINPEVETNAAIKRIDGGLSTHAKEVALIDGDDWDSMLPTLSREMKQKRAAGVMPAAKAATVAPDQYDKSGQPVDQPDDKQQDDQQLDNTTQPDDQGDE